MSIMQRLHKLQISKFVNLGMIACSLKNEAEKGLYMRKVFDKNASQVVKGLAILMLLMYHLFEHEELIQSMEVNYSPFPLQGFLTVTGFGNICVSVFVFLTAYGITESILYGSKSGASLKEAYRQASIRFGKLILNFFALFLSVNLLWGSIFDYEGLYGEGKQGFLYMLSDAAGFSQFWDTPTMNMTWWYMKVAYILIFLVPAMAFIVRKIGYPILWIAFLIPFAVDMDEDVRRYFFVTAFGVCASYGKWPDKMLNLRINPVLKWVLGLAALVVSILVRQNYVVYQTYAAYVEAPIVLVIIFLACQLLGSIPFVDKSLGFIGRHSMNIYLVHTFFYMSLWRDFIYSFRHAGLIFLTLFITTLLYSIVLEFAKYKMIVPLYRKTVTYIKSLLKR